MINLFLLEEMESCFTINCILQATRLEVRFLSNVRLRRRKGWIKCKKLRHKINLALIQVSK